VVLEKEIQYKFLRHSHPLKLWFPLPTRLPLLILEILLELCEEGTVEGVRGRGDATLSFRWWGWRRLITLTRVTEALVGRWWWVTFAWITDTWDLVAFTGLTDAGLLNLNLLLLTVARVTVTGTIPIGIGGLYWDFLISVEIRGCGNIRRLILSVIHSHSHDFTLTHLTDTGVTAAGVNGLFFILRVTREEEGFDEEPSQRTFPFPSLTPILILILTVVLSLHVGKEFWRKKPLSLSRLAFTFQFRDRDKYCIILSERSQCIFFV
jgi:hypothetical protein